MLIMTGRRGAAECLPQNEIQSAARNLRPLIIRSFVATYTLTARVSFQFQCWSLDSVELLLCMPYAEPQ